MIIVETIDLKDFESKYDPRKQNVEILAAPESVKFFAAIRERLAMQLCNYRLEEITMRAFQLSPAGYAFDTYGIGEMLKNAVSAGANKINVVIIFNGNVASSSLNPADITCILIDDGKGFGENFLNKDPMRKEYGSGFADYRRVIAPELGENVDQFLHSTEDVAKIKSPKIEEKREEKRILGYSHSIGGKGEGLGGLTKALARVGGYLEIGDVSDLRMSPYFQLCIDKKIIPTMENGSVILMHSPQFSQALCNTYSDAFSRRYVHFLVNWKVMSPEFATENSPRIRDMQEEIEISEKCKEEKEEVPKSQEEDEQEDDQKDEQEGDQEDDQENVQDRQERYVVSPLSIFSSSVSCSSHSPSSSSASSSAESSPISSPSRTPQSALFSRLSIFTEDLPSDGSTQEEMIKKPSGLSINLPANLTAQVKRT